MDLTHTTWILLITAVVLVKGDECPHADPQARSMTCIKDLPSVQYKPVATTQTTTDASGLREAREKRQTHSGSYNATSVEEAPSRDTMPPSTPDITREFIEYFCSESGVKMVHCAKELIEKCSDHPSMREALFNPVQALKAQSLCSRYMTPNFNETVECVNDVMSTERLAKCIFMAHSGGLKHMCRTTAEIYNCFVGIIGAACGREKVGFVVAVMRSMEPIGCRPIVDSVYADPIQWTSSSTLATPLSSLLMLIIVSVTFSLKRL